MIGGDRQRWLLLGVEDAARRLLRPALGSDRQQASQAARRSIEELIARGYFDFWTLLT
jgi:hypothetical protein